MISISSRQCVRRTSGAISSGAVSTGGTALAAAKASRNASVAPAVGRGHRSAAGRRDHVQLLGPVRVRDRQRRSHLDRRLEPLGDPAAAELVVGAVGRRVRVEHDHRVVRGPRHLLLDDELPCSRRRAPMHGPRLVAEHVVAQREEVLVAARRRLANSESSCWSAGNADRRTWTVRGCTVSTPPSDRPATRRTIDHGSPWTTAYGPIGRSPRAEVSTGRRSVISPPDPAPAPATSRPASDGDPSTIRSQCRRLRERAASSARSPAARARPERRLVQRHLHARRTAGDARRRARRERSRRRPVR